MRSRLRRGAAMSLAGLAATMATLLWPAVPALAHVTVSSVAATQGGYAELTFRVPNEKDGAATTKLELHLPADSPVASVSVKPVPGWAAQPDKTKLATPIKDHDGELTEAVTKITWTAGADAAIKPGQFQEFEVSVGPLPEKDQLVFKALQTYSDGDIVRWIDEPAAGAEPEHPAPVLKLAKKSDQNGSSAAATAPAVADAGAGGNESDNGEGPALALGIAGLVAGLAGLGAGLAAYRKASAPRP